MYGSRWLKASGWVLVADGVAHMAGHFSGISNMGSSTDPKTVALAEAMKGFLVPDWPADKTILSLFIGFSLVFSVFSILSGVLIVAAAGAMKQQRQAMRRLAILVTAGTATLGAVSMVYFIFPPTTFFVLSFLLAAVALFKATAP